MAKMMFVPDWLSEMLTDRGLSLSVLDTYESLSTILSRNDVLNYFFAQVEYCKFVHDDTFNSLYEFSQCYAEVMHMQMANEPELAIYMKDAYQKPVDISLLVCERITGFAPDSCKLSIVNSDDNKISYIIGGSVKINSLEMSLVKQVDFSALALLTGVLSRSYNGLRVITESTDKSAVLRENYFLTQLYVKCLCCSK